RLDVGQRPGDPLVGVVHRFVDGLAVLGGQAVFLVPDIERGFLEGDRVDVFGFDLHYDIHGPAGAPLFLKRLFHARRKEYPREAPEMDALAAREPSEDAALRTASRNP